MDGGDFPVLTSGDLLYLPNDLEASLFLGFEKKADEEINNTDLNY